MNLHFLLRLSLTLHIAGLSVALGTALACFVIAGKIRKAAAGEPPLVTTLFATISGLPSLMSIGMAVSIISGVAMMQLAYAAFMYELWFRLKIGVILLLFVNGIIAARVLAKGRKRATQNDTGMGFVAQKMRALYGIQFLLFLLIVLLATFRFQ